MSYYFKRVYVCDICRKEEVASPSFSPDKLPNNWGGDSSEQGHCLCQDCYKAFKELRTRQHKNEI